MVLNVHFQIVEEDRLTNALEDQIRTLLQLSYPQDADFWATASYWGSPPVARALLLDGMGRPVSHLGFGYRQIQIGKHEVQIAGIGAVATHPEHQGQGHGCQLLQSLWEHLQSRTEWMFLGCRDAVVPFYQRAGFLHSKRRVHCLNPDLGVWEDQHWNVMVRPVHSESFGLPEGRVQLRGLPW